jgi:hypothetical protein
LPKYTGYTTVWSRATSVTFGTIATINNVNSVTPGFGSERVLYDQSAYGDQWMDWAVLQQDGVEFTMTLQWDPADAVHLLLKSDYETPVANTWIKANHAISAKAYNITTVCRAFSINPTRDGSLEATFGFKVVNPGFVMV